MSFSCGDTFLNKSSAGVPAHLWVIISDPNQTPERVVIVNFTTWRGLPGEDRSCLFHEGEHPFVKHKTYVNYRDAMIVETSKMEKLQASGSLWPRQAVSDSLLGRILEGAEASLFLKLEIRKILEDQDLI